MESTLTIGSSLFRFKRSTSSLPKSRAFPKTPLLSISKFTMKSNSHSHPNPSLVSVVKTTAASIIYAAAVFSKFHQMPVARAQPPPPPVTEEKELSSSPLAEFLESNPQATEALKNLLQQKLEVGEDEESLKILKKLMAAHPDDTEWKFLTARLLNEMHRNQEAREVFEEILSKNPLSFEALFENALLMDRCGEGVKVIERLEKALKVAEEENKPKEARDIRLIMAQVKFLQKNVEEALRIYDELSAEDPNDFRPYFCKGIIYSLLDRNNEAREEFAKFRQLSPKKFDVEGYLRTPLSRKKLFGTDE